MVRDNGLRFERNEKSKPMQILLIDLAFINEIGYRLAAKCHVKNFRG